LRKKDDVRDKNTNKIKIGGGEKKERYRGTSCLSGGTVWAGRGGHKKENIQKWLQQQQGGKKTRRNHRKRREYDAAR